MYPYKVIHLDATQLAKKNWLDSGGKFDGLTTSKEIEALLIEKHEDGYELVSIVPVTGFKVISGSFGVSFTESFIITLKKQEAEVKKA